MIFYFCILFSLYLKFIILNVFSHLFNFFHFHSTIKNLDFLKCPPGPLGKRKACQNGNRNGGGDEGAGGDDQQNSSWGWSNSNNAGGDADDGGRSWTNWFTGGSGVNNQGAQGAADENYNAANVVRAGSFPWFVMVFGLTALATGAGWFVYETVSSSESESESESESTLHVFVYTTTTFYNS